MMRPMRVGGGLLLVGLIAVVAQSRARACGGGVVVKQGGAGADTQRIFFSAHADHTDVITEIGVPATTADYGVLLPVPAEPTLDPQPVAAAELNALDQNTLPRIYVFSSADDGGCGCLAPGGSKSNGTTGPGDITVSQPVNIGPVTAVVLTGTTGDAVNGWLADNGFMIPAAQQPLVDAYAGPGRFFIAVRRNDTATTGAASSVGVHFTLPGAQRSLPLRFAQLGAAAEVAFTVFVAAPTAVAPAAPFATLTLTDLDAATLKTSGYVTAVRKAIGGQADRAFVIDGTYATASLSGRIGSGVESLFEPGAQLTRLTAIFPAATLTDDVTFDRVFTGTAPTVRYVTREPIAPSRRWALGPSLLLAFAALWTRRRSSH
jgi:hypothetical protein